VGKVRFDGFGFETRAAEANVALWADEIRKKRRELECGPARLRWRDQRELRGCVADRRNSACLRERRLAKQNQVEVQVAELLEEILDRAGGSEPQAEAHRAAGAIASGNPSNADISLGTVVLVEHRGDGVELQRGSADANRLCRSA
jgi:hypothetical protein